MEKRPLCHNYTREAYASGWAVTDFEPIDSSTAIMSAFGLKRDIPHQTLEQAYLLAGEEVVISMPDGEVLYEITKITYRRDPYDAYRAELKYVQHLTGFRGMRQCEPGQHARRLEWSQQRNHTASDSD